MKMLILAAAGVLILGGAGGGAYFFFMKSAHAAVDSAADHGEAKKEHKKEAKKGGDGHGAPQIAYVELDPLILPIIDKRGISQTVSMVVTIEVADPAAAAKVEELGPRLKDAYIQEMYGVLSKQDALVGGVVQVNQIKERLTAISHKVMGEGVVQDVLLQAVQQRPI